MHSLRSAHRVGRDTISFHYHPSCSALLPSGGGLLLLVLSYHSSANDRTLQRLGSSHWVVRSSDCSLEDQAARARCPVCPLTPAARSFL